MRHFTLILVLLLCQVCLALTAEQPFRDLPAGHWAFDAVESLHRRGILSGFSDDTFRGTQPVSRFSFAVALARALEEFPRDSKGVREVHLTGGDATQVQRLVKEFDTELDLLGVRVGSLDERVELYRRENRKLERRVKELETGGDRSIQFSGGELRVAEHNGSDRSALFTLILNTDFRASENVEGRAAFQFSNQLDGGLTEGVNTFEAYADFKEPGGPFERIRAGKFLYQLGAGQVLSSTVEGFDLRAGRGRDRYSVLFADDLIVQVLFPTFAEGEMGYYYIKEGGRPGSSDPFHVGMFLRGDLGTRFSYAFEFSDYDNRIATPANLNRKTRGFLSSIDWKLGSRFGLQAAAIVQEEDFRAFAIDHDLRWHRDRWSPLEDVFQTLDAFSGGATLGKNEINGFSDLKLGVSGRPFRTDTEIFVGVDALSSHSSFFDNRASAFQVWTVRLTRELDEGSNLQLRWHSLRFDNPSPATTVRTLPINREDGDEVRLQYVSMF